MRQSFEQVLFRGNIFLTLLAIRLTDGDYDICGVIKSEK